MGVIWSDFKGKTIEQPNNSHQILVRMLLNLDFFLFWKANWAPPTPNQRGRRRSTERGKKKTNDKYRNLSCETTRTVSLAENCLHLGTSSTVWSTKLCAALFFWYSYIFTRTWLFTFRLTASNWAETRRIRVDTTPLPFLQHLEPRRQGWMVIRWCDEYAWASGWFWNRARVSWKQRFSPLALFVLRRTWC